MPAVPQWSMTMAGPGCSSMDANRQLPVSVPACATGTMIRVVTDTAMTPGFIVVDKMNVVAVVPLSNTSIAPYRDNNGKGQSRPSADGATLKTWH
ncbi:MAG: hypothetical protein IJV49_01215 [Aeriscardovia sp.]|nr:hypothetical protein [Aeriscardovia sp.]